MQRMLHASPKGSVDYKSWVLKVSREGQEVLQGAVWKRWGFEEG